MRDLTAAVVDAVHMAGFVEIEVSAKHVHLTQEDVEVLFGKVQSSSRSAVISAWPVPLRAARDADRAEEEHGAGSGIRTGSQCHTGRTLKERLCGPWSHSTGKGVRRHRRFRLDHDSGSVRDTGSEGRSDHRP